MIVKLEEAKSIPKPILSLYLKNQMKEDNMIAEVWLRFAPPNKPFLLALRGAPVQDNTGDWQWLAQQDRQRFTVPYAERLSKGSILCKQ